MKQNLHQKCQNMTVLFVEDYIPLQKKIASILSDYFKHVQIASNGKEALEKYENFYETNRKFYNIVITDYEMPKLTGIELIKAIKKGNKEQTFIVLSAHQNPEYLIEYISLGISHFIPKPIGPNKLLEVLDKVCDMMVVMDDKLFHINNSLVWNKNKRALFFNNEYLYLAKYDLLLFEVLMEDFGFTCTIDKILSHFYLYNEDVKQENIRNMVIRLRKKIPDIQIKNTYGMGYALLKD